MACLATAVSALVTCRLRNSLSKSKYSVTLAGSAAFTHDGAWPRGVTTGGGASMPSSAGSSVLQAGVSSRITDTFTALQRDAAADAALADRALDQRLVPKLRRVEVAGHAALLAQVVELAFVLGEPARLRLGVAHDRTGEELTPLARLGSRTGARLLRLGRLDAERGHERQRDERRGRMAPHSTPRKLIRSCLSWLVSRMSKRRS